MKVFDVLPYLFRCSILILPPPKAILFLPSLALNLMKIPIALKLGVIKLYEVLML